MTVWDWFVVLASITNLVFIFLNVGFFHHNCRVAMTTRRLRQRLDERENERREVWREALKVIRDPKGEL